MYRVASFFVLLVLLAGTAHGGGREHPERWYQAQWCDGRGTMEVVLADGSRCDCLTGDYAVEFDFADKWAEAVGQSLNYAAETGKRPGIVLIMERPGDARYLERILAIDRAHGLGLTVWTVGPQRVAGRD